MTHSKRIIAEYRARKEARYRATAIVYTLISIFAIYYPLWVGLGGINM